MNFADAIFFTTPPQLAMSSGTATITAVESLATSTDVNIDNLEVYRVFPIQGSRQNVMVGIDPIAAPMAELEGAIDALKSHAFSLKSTMRATPMEERMLALENAINKSLEEPVRKTAQSIQVMGGRPTYGSVVAPPATKAAV